MVFAMITDVFILFVVGGVLALAVGIPVGAITLRGAVSLYNKIVGETSPAVPEPSMGKAMGIMLVIMLIDFVVGFFVGSIVGGAAPRGRGIHASAQLISLGIGAIVMAGTFSAMLPTKFGRAVLVTLCYILIMLLVVAFGFGLVLVVCLLLSSLAPR